MKQDKLYSIKYINGFEFRVYNESEVTPMQVFYSELEMYFKQCINEDYYIYILNNKPIHNIEFTNEDINYINLDPHDHQNESLNYYFSENLKYIKENQYKDFKGLIYKNKLDFLICIPNLDENNKYYYNFVIGLKDNNKINNIIKHKFNLVKFHSLLHLNQTFFDAEFLEKLFKIKHIENENTITTLFRNNFLNNAELIGWVFSEGKYFSTKKHSKMYLTKFCFHFYYDDSLKKMNVYANSFELEKRFKVFNSDSDVKIENISYSIPFLDLIDNDDKFLFFMVGEMKKFHGTVIDGERDFLKSEIEEIKNFNGDEPDQKLLDGKKWKVIKFKTRLKEYRKLLKDNKKNK